MKRVIISGYYGFGNLGDEALLRAIVTGLRQRVAGLEIVVPSADPATTAASHGVRSVPRANPLLWWSLLGNCDLLISGGGSLLQDVTGPWNIPYYAGVIMMAKLRKVPVMIFGQGVGPIRGYWGRKVTRYVVEQADIVTVRDPGSRKFLEGLGVRRDIVLVADPVFSLHFDQLPRMENHDAPLRIGVALRQRGLTRELIHRLAGALDQLAAGEGRRGIHFVFFPMQPQEDVEAAIQVANRLRSSHEVIVDRLSLDETVRIIATCDLVVAMRLHALILAALAGTPMVGISYDPKVGEFLQRVDGVILAVLPDVPPVEVIASKLAEVMARRKWYQEQLDKHLPELRLEAEKSCELAASLLLSR